MLLHPIRRLGVIPDGGSFQGRRSSGKREIPPLQPWLEIAMPRYHFNVQDGMQYPDTQGTALPNLEAARMEAVERIGALLRDNAESFWNGEKWNMTVTDENRMVMFTLHFLATNSPATQEYKQPNAFR
jgi:hypothetical protein